MTKIEVWHFTEKPGILRDGSPLTVGQPLPHLDGAIEPCRNGYHGSPLLLDALNYAPGPHLYRRTLSGVIVPHGDPIDKYAASDAIATTYRDATPLLRVHARQCAADVFYLWKPPQVVQDYILSGDKALRAAAGDAAWDAAGDAAWAAARAAAWDAAWAAARAAAGDAAGDAAGAAARAAARDAAWDAAWAAARDAARAAARDAAGDAQRTRLEAWGIAFMADGALPEVVIPERAKA